MNKMSLQSQKKYLIFFNLFLILLLLTPQYAFAAPLTGADHDLTVYFNYSMMGGYTNDTTDANDADALDDGDNGGGDILWTAGGNPDTQSRYFGYNGGPFSKLLINVQTATGNSSPLTIQYYNGVVGDGWASLTIDSGATSLQSTGIQTIAFTPPEDWISTTVNGVAAYYIRTQTSNGNAGLVASQASVYVGGGGGGGGGGTSVPEFTNIVYALTLATGALYIWKRVGQKNESTNL